MAKVSSDPLGLGTTMVGPLSVAQILRLGVICMALWSAYTIRLFAIIDYGLVIHEFDPWFNYRATEYLWENGWTEFFHWFDHRSWYPLGRPVGTTIFPGMQITSCVICKALEMMGPTWAMSLNDVCCYVPAWFGTLATGLLGMLTYECTHNANAGVTAAAIMAIIPAHIMRSVGGGYDNESVAMTSMCATFYLWVRALRGEGSWPIGALAGVMYIYMVMNWGGYIFVINMVALHALGLVALGRHTTKLHRAYTLFYIIGTIGATHVPVVGWAPLKSLEQLGAFGVFLIIQIWEFVEMKRRAFDAGKHVNDKMKWQEVNRLRMQTAGVLAAVGLAVIIVVLPSGYFGPLSSRIRGLFVQHTRTGNPLVDSVAEHQPANAGAYWQYMHMICWFGPVGFFMCFKERTDSKYFLIFYAITAYFFSLKMVRLIVLMGPIASALGGLAISSGIEWSIAQAFNHADGETSSDDEASEEEEEEVKVVTARDKKGVASRKKQPSSPKKASKKAPAPKRKKRPQGPGEELEMVFEQLTESADTPAGQMMRKGGAMVFALILLTNGPDFYGYCTQMAHGMSQPSIMFKATLSNGQPVMVDDYREAYWWLRDNTQEDARVMAWWDYGYQLAGIANRTTIADGNTWNHEHIATLGRCLVSPEKEAHRIIRHLADYVLIWTGGGGDDLAKSPHMARIGNSVFNDICPGDPTCSKFGFVDQQMTPTPMMAKSLLYKLNGHGQMPGVTVDPQRFREVFSSKFQKVRIFKVLKVSKKSKDWVADTANWICDAPGSWYCDGQYPPALQDLIGRRKNFAQLEDFNTKRSAEDDEYNKEYMRRMAGEGGMGDFHAPGDDDEDYDDDEEVPEQKQKLSRAEKRKLDKDKRKKEDAETEADVPEDPEDIVEEDDGQGIELPAPPSADTDAPAGPAPWADTPVTTRLWGLIHANDYEQLAEWIEADPSLVHSRSADGRGPLWWAYEYAHDDIVELLTSYGIDGDLVDDKGMSAKEMAQ